MTKQKLRKIVVDGAEFLWKFDPRYRETGPCQYECFDTFIAYLAGYRNSPLRMHFMTWEDPVIGGPLRCGGPLAPGGPNSGINLHTPKWAALLIRRAREKGWTPALSSRLWVVVNDLDWFAELAAQAE